MCTGAARVVAKRDCVNRGLTISEGARAHRPMTPLYGVGDGGEGD